jgi:hypothetical protein
VGSSSPLFDLFATSGTRLAIKFPLPTATAAATAMLGVTILIGATVVINRKCVCVLEGFKKNTTN